MKTQLQITHRFGAEGPRHDPYGFDEWIVTIEDGRKAVMHIGLGVWAKIDGVKFSGGKDDYGADEVFEKFVGRTIREVQKVYWKSRGQKAGPHVPFNLALHHHLLSLGYEWTRNPESWEDTGGPESGPRLSGGPAYDEYESPDDFVYASEDGSVDCQGAEQDPPEEYVIEEHEDTPYIEYNGFDRPGDY
jgi:hypothetical protein